MQALTYDDFFQRLTGHTPFPYQRRLGEQPWPKLVDVPTGLGKTAAVVVAWLWKRLHGDPNTGRRLVYCLPMRVLVEQTHQAAEHWCNEAAPLFEEAGLQAPTPHLLMGGWVDETWEKAPERPAVLVGTQDMLLSRALNRGYAMRRFRWPMHFALLGSDCLWAFDEVQLMGVAVETSAQLDAFRKQLGTLGPSHSVWMSATLGRKQLDTVDHPEPEEGWSMCELDGTDRDLDPIQNRLAARKPVEPLSLSLTRDNEKNYPDELAAQVQHLHADRGGLTVVFINRVQRAIDLFESLQKRGVEPLGLVHSRFRPADRDKQESLLHGDEDRLVVTTQALEAGVDVSARTMVTELAPWPSLVQRFGRCNRYGEQSAAGIYWIDLDSSDDDLALPYSHDDLTRARVLLDQCADAGPAPLRKLPYDPPQVIRPVIRKRDLLDLFDTTPDLYGHDVDVSRYIRDGEDTDVQVFWRPFAPDAPPPRTLPNPSRHELCSVSLGSMHSFLKSLGRWWRKLAQGSDKDRSRLHCAVAWEWSAVDRQWTRVDRVRPGQTILLHPEAGGYDTERGWTGQHAPKEPVPELESEEQAGIADDDTLDGDAPTAIRRWVALDAHLGHVGSEAEGLTSQLSLPEQWAEAVVTAARWHDLGKAHPAFQKRLLQPTESRPEYQPPAEGPWAKSNHRFAASTDRPFFRHELASALAWLQTGHLDDTPATRDLVAYLIAAHHGQVRLTIRSVPGEPHPDDGRLFARGVWSGDELPAVHIPDRGTVEPVSLELSPMQLGEGSWAERMLALRDHPDMGPFRLAMLECLVRVADWRASEKESAGDYNA